MWIAEQQSEKDLGDNSSSDGSQPRRLKGLVLGNRELHRFHVQHGLSKNIRPQRTLAFKLSSSDIGDGLLWKPAFEALADKNTLVVERRHLHRPRDILSGWQS